jgi:hypothetical protein
MHLPTCVVELILQGTAMSDHQRAGVRNRASSQLAERSLRLVDQQVDDMPRAHLPQSAQSPQKRLADESRFGAERAGTHCVAAAAHTGVHQHRGASAHFAGDRRQRVNRRRQRVNLTSAVVGNNDAVDADRYGLVSILRM